MDDALGVHRQYSAKISIMIQRLRQIRQIIEQKKGQRDKINSLLLFCRKEIAVLKKRTNLFRASTDDHSEGSSGNAETT